MTESTPQQLKATSEVRMAAAKAVLKRQQDTMFKSIFSAAQLKAVDKWTAAKDPTLSRSEAIARLVELGLKVK